MKNGIKAIETEYKGYRFRSRTEARWAVFFDAMGFYWTYEEEGYELPSGRYLPDFCLHDVYRKLFVEIKGVDLSSDELQLCFELAVESGVDVLAISGCPSSISGNQAIWRPHFGSLLFSGYRPTTFEHSSDELFFAVQLPAYLAMDCNYDGALPPAWHLDDEGKREQYVKALLEIDREVFIKRHPNKSRSNWVYGIGLHKWDYGVCDNAFFKKTHRSSDIIMTNYFDSLGALVFDSLSLAQAARFEFGGTKEIETQIAKLAESY